MVDTTTKASRKELLEYIKSMGYIAPWQLEAKFGYTKRGAINKITELRIAGLITNSTYGKWNLTFTGLRRLEYYYAKDNGKNKSTGI